MGHDSTVLVTLCTRFLASIFLNEVIQREEEVRCIIDVQKDRKVQS